MNDELKEISLEDQKTEEDTIHKIELMSIGQVIYSLALFAAFGILIISTFNSFLPKHKTIHKEFKSTPNDGFSQTYEFAVSKIHPFHQLLTFKMKILNPNKLYPSKAPAQISTKYSIIRENAIVSEKEFTYDKEFFFEINKSYSSELVLMSARTSGFDSFKIQVTLQSLSDLSFIPAFETETDNVLYNIVVLSFRLAGFFISLCLIAIFKPNDTKFSLLPRSTRTVILLLISSVICSDPLMFVDLYYNLSSYKYISYATQYFFFAFCCFVGTYILQQNYFLFNANSTFMETFLVYIIGFILLMVNLVTAVVFDKPGSYRVEIGEFIFMCLHLIFLTVSALKSKKPENKAELVACLGGQVIIIILIFIGRTNNFGNPIVSLGNTPCTHIILAGYVFLIAFLYSPVIKAEDQVSDWSPNVANDV